MKRLQSFLFLFAAVAGLRAAPLARCPDNPHYFLWRGRPEIIIASGEHYGAVLNLDFDFRRTLSSESGLSLASPTMDLCFRRNDRKLRRI
jgi:hypothetical protein